MGPLPIRSPPPPPPPAPRPLPSIIGRRYSPRRSSPFFSSISHFFSQPLPIRSPFYSSKVTILSRSPYASPAPQTLPTCSPRSPKYRKNVTRNLSFLWGRSPSAPPRSPSSSSAPHQLLFTIDRSCFSFSIPFSDLE